MAKIVSTFIASDGLHLNQNNQHVMNFDLFDIGCFENLLFAFNRTKDTFNRVWIFYFTSKGERQNIVENTRVRA